MNKPLPSTLITVARKLSLIFTLKNLIKLCFIVIYFISGMRVIKLNGEMIIPVIIDSYLVMSVLILSTIFYYGLYSLLRDLINFVKD
jgi:hypothetical protein